MYCFFLLYLIPFFNYLLCPFYCTGLCYVNKGLSTEVKTYINYSTGAKPLVEIAARN